jgi:hypothetical protein
MVVVRAGTLIVAGLVLAACSGPGAGPSPEVPSGQASTARPSVVATEDCPTGTGETALPEAGSLFHQPELITDYLNAGGDVDRLLETLTSGGLLPVYPQVWPAAIEDLDGDGQLDLAASLQDLSAPIAQRPPGSLFIWLCREGRYDLLYQSPAEADHSAPLLLAAADLTGDQASELVFGRPACGAHTCFLAVGVLQWDGVDFVDRWRGSSEDLPTPEVSVSQPSPSAAASISVTSNGVQSVGAGPPRPRTRRWSWDEEMLAFMPGPDVWSSPVYRVHMVHDADRAYRKADNISAEALYLEALEEAGLLDWEADPATPASLDAYIRYRLVLNDLAQSDIEDAQADLDAMAEASRGIPEAGVFVEMAQLLVRVYRDSLDLAQACSSVRGFAEDHVSGVLEPLYYGYDNPVYTAEDLCPASQEA